MVSTRNALQQALRFGFNKVKQSSAKVAAAELTQGGELNLSKDGCSTSLSTNHPPLPTTTVGSVTSRGANFQKNPTDPVLMVTVVDPVHSNHTQIGETVEENQAKPASITQTARDRKAINESLIYAAIPFLPLPIAIVCFLLNLLLPGSGTVLAGMAILLVGQPRLEVRETRTLLTMLINCCVGVSQFATVTFFLIGWFWSIAWGGLFIMHSITYRRTLMLRRQKAVLQFMDKANGENISIGGRVFSEVLHLQPNGSTTSPVTSNVPGEEQKMKPKKSSICTRIKLFFKNK